MQEKATAKYQVLARGVILSDHHLLVAHCKGMDHTFLRKLIHKYIEIGSGTRGLFERKSSTKMGPRRK